MNIFLLNCYFLFVNSFIPNWNFSSTSEDIFKNSSTYTQEITKNWGDCKITLKKVFKKENNIISQVNLISFFPLEDIIVYFDDIESFYHLNNNNYICPKGSNHFSIIENNNIREIKTNLLNKSKWELKCYFQPFQNSIFIFYLQTETICKFNVGDYDFIKCLNMNKITFDFFWTIDKINDNDEYIMIALQSDNIEINLNKILVTIRYNDFSFNTINSLKSFNISNFTDGTFLNINNDYKNYLCYWLTYNTSFYNSSYTLNYISISHFRDENNIVNNGNLFNYNININYIVFIRNTHLAYFKGEVEEFNFNTLKYRNVTYYGIINIKNNQIIYNTNEKIYEIKIFSSNEILLRTSSSFFKICSFAKDQYNNCINECPLNQELILDTEKFNYCGNKIGNYCNNYILKPYDICVQSCDETIYFVQDNYTCILCQDLYPNKPYKIYGVNQCFENKPENTFIFYEKLNILKYCHQTCKTCSGEEENECLSCDIGYIFKEGKCLKCFETCNECKEQSFNIKEQKCISCKYPNQLLQEDKGNCLDNCLDGYYEDNKICRKCHSNCLTCNHSYSEENYQCTSCKDNQLLEYDTKKCINKCDISYYEKSKMCFKCNSNCKSCSRESENNNNYCISCNENSTFRYLVNSTQFGFNCVKSCPNGTILKEDINQCITYENHEVTPNFVFIWGFLIIIMFFFLICCVMYFVFQCQYPKNDHLEDGIMIKKDINQLIEF